MPANGSMTTVRRRRGDRAGDWPQVVTCKERNRAQWDAGRPLRRGTPQTGRSR